MASGVMRAIRVAQFGGPEVMKLVSNVPVPKPQHKQVLIKVMAAGVNPVDTYVREGVYVYKPALPYTPGMDSSGIVEAVGEGVTKVKPGDRVCTVNSVTGSYAEYLLADEMLTFHLHDNLSFPQGAAVGVPYFSAYRGLFLRAEAKPGQSVLVHGASGAVGLAACQMARAHGLRVLGTAGTDQGQALVTANGAHQAFNHREPGYTDQIMEATGGKGVDIIIEMFANLNLNTDFLLLAPRGKLVVIGSRGNVEFNPRQPKESSIMRVVLMQSPEEDWQVMGAAMEAGMEQGWVKPVIAEEYPLSEAAKAHTEVIQHTGGSKGNIIINVR